MTKLCFSDALPALTTLDQECGVYRSGERFKARRWVVGKQAEARDAKPGIKGMKVVREVGQGRIDEAGHPAGQLQAGRTYR